MSHIVPLEDCIHKAQGKIFLGIDLGTRFTGVALSNPEHTLAVPLEVIRSSSYPRLALKIHSIMKQYHATWIILGIPLHPKSPKGKGCTRSQDFAQHLAPAPVCFWDESFSTCGVHRDEHSRTEMDRNDHFAAAIILQGALDRICHLKRRQSLCTDNPTCEHTY